VESWRGFKIAPTDIFEDFLVVTSVVLYLLGWEFVEGVLIAHKT